MTHRQRRWPCLRSRLRQARVVLRRGPLHNGAMAHPADDNTQTEQVVGCQATPAEVVADPEVMGGQPCFVGTRVPASIVVASVDKGFEWSRLVAAYPFVTEAHVAAARAYLAARENLAKAPANWHGLSPTSRSVTTVRSTGHSAPPSESGQRSAETKSR
jgi:uncharacterized protein (DUF433 family)